MEEIAVHRIGLLGSGGHRDTMFLSILNHFGAPRKSLAENFVSPRRNYPNVWSKRCHGQFKAYLIISFPRRAMSDCFRIFRSGYLYHSLGNERAGDASTKIVLIFIQRRSLKHRKNEVSRELIAQIVDVTLGGTGAQCFLF